MGLSISFRKYASSLAFLCALGSPAIAFAQTGEVMSDTEIAQLPAEYRSAPVQDTVTETVTNDAGVETIVRTRRIERSYPVRRYRSPGDASSYGPTGYENTAYAPATAVFERDQWVEECNRRTNGRSEDEKGGIIGGLLGAFTGGLIGNRIADGDRLAGTLIGGATGGLGGFLLGNLIGGGKKDDAYDCEAALDSYLSQYGPGPKRIGSRTIPAPAYGSPSYAPQPTYGYAPGYTYTPQQQMIYVPVRYEQPQRVIVRETIREETYEVPGSSRTIDGPRRVEIPPYDTAPE
ncbi:glycine zipper 2TM domain-containing protein [Erythrobacter sp. MTPC3]|uniref:glycine zipper 2TM domain-containing protein n=1 Tax=Erythrobacter sp. MTPC3 TaxID=3056564 RepID=UPI0036F28B86